MKDLLEFIIKRITSKPEEVRIDLVEDSGISDLKLAVAQEDYGTIIGKNGRTIKSIRDVLRIRAQKENIRFNLTLEEPSNPPNEN